MPPEQYRCDAGRGYYFFLTSPYTPWFQQWGPSRLFVNGGHDENLGSHRRATALFRLCFLDDCRTGAECESLGNQHQFWECGCRCYIHAEFEHN